MCVYVCMCICVCLCMCIRVYFCVSLCVHVFRWLYTCSISWVKMKMKFAIILMRVVLIFHRRCGISGLVSGLQSKVTLIHLLVQSRTWMLRRQRLARRKKKKKYNINKKINFNPNYINIYFNFLFFKYSKEYLHYFTI